MAFLSFLSLIILTWLVLLDDSRFGDGEVIFGAQVAARVLSFFAAPAATASSGSDPAFPELSARECQILDLLASGQRTAAIAEQLYLSPKTVSNNLTAIFAKLQVASRAEAIVLARERGLGGGR